MGAFIVLVLGAMVGIPLHRISRHFWMTSAGAALVATMLWGAGCYLLFALSAPNEMGLPLVMPVLLTLGTAFIGAAAAGGMLHAIRTR